MSTTENQTPVIPTSFDLGDRADAADRAWTNYQSRAMSAAHAIGEIDWSAPTTEDDRALLAILANDARAALAAYELAHDQFKDACSIRRAAGL